MAKKKKLTPSQKRRKKVKRLKTQLTRFLIITIIGTFLFTLSNPSLIADDTKRGRVESFRDEVIEFGVISQDKVAGAITEATDIIEEGLKKTKIPKNLSGSDEEIVIDEMVSIITEDIKSLPADQLKKVKTQFCQDVINEATKSSNNQ